ncbi:MAG: CTP synthase [Candidatus Lokiarchaeota archaeon]|nr:CTP synthase [Candidatus Lokiarchaeota archaeon]
MKPKFVFVTGGVMSGIGKGVTTASIAKLFQFRGFNISIAKIDPYLNIDPGTLNPIEHGECFVAEDVWMFDPLEGENLGFKPVRIAELDQDFGTYERFTGQNISPSHNITSGQIYYSTIVKERAGRYLGRTVQLIPHCTNEVIKRLGKTAEEEDLDVLLVECGGTVGDFESVLFLESFRQMRLSYPKSDTLLVHVTLVPYLETVGQLKSKPTQHSVRALQSGGLQPDVLICRSKYPLTPEVKRKISLFSNIKERSVIGSPDLDSIYNLPLEFENQNLGDIVCEKLQLTPKLVEYSKINNFSEWEKMVQLFDKKPKDKQLIIGMPGKYTDISDSYVSINEALKHACFHNGFEPKIEWINTEQLIEDRLDKCDGILLTPGFGSRGVEGMIKCAEYSIKNKIPYLGICFGAQLMYVAYCRTCLGLEKANSTEINQNTPYPVINYLEGQENKIGKGGTMRLGAHEIKLVKGTKLYNAYHKDVIKERFRHRFHIIDRFIDKSDKDCGLVVSARDMTGNIVNAIEIKGEHFMVGVQFHAEFKSKPYKPSPVYDAFIKAIIENKNLT